MSFLPPFSGTSLREMLFREPERGRCEVNSFLISALQDFGEQLKFWGSAGGEFNRGFCRTLLGGRSTFGHLVGAPGLADELVHVAAGVCGLDRDRAMDIAI